MRRASFLALLAAAGFVVVLLWRLPARWALALLPRSVACTAVDGSIWMGTCTGLTVEGQPYGDLLWTLHPAALLTGALSAHIVLTNGPSTGRADVEARPGSRIVLRNVVADLPLDPAVIPHIPPTLGGSAHLDLARVTLTGEVITQLQGRIEAHDLVDRTRGTTALGSFAVIFPPGSSGIPTAHLRDLGGPLSFEGTLQLTLKPGFTGHYLVQGLVSARPTATSDLRQGLMMLGSPDAEGRRQFGLEGTF